MAVSLVLNQWFLLTLDYRMICENRRKGICSFAAVLTFAQIKPAKINLSLIGRF